MSGTNFPGVLIRQFETGWKLASFHLEGLTTEECLWRPAPVGLHVHRGDDGQWRADWPDRETYDVGPASIAWLTWHFGYWWSMALDHSFGEAILSRERVTWPGSAEATVAWLHKLQIQWRSALGLLDEAGWHSRDRTRWPFRDRPFGDLAAWANVELTKSAAEIGYARFLYAAMHSP